MINDRGARYIIVGGYHSNDQRDLAMERYPRTWAAFCPGRRACYPLVWEASVLSKEHGYMEYPVVDLRDPDTRHNFIRRYPAFDLARFT